MRRGPVQRRSTTSATVCPNCAGMPIMRIAARVLTGRTSLALTELGCALPPWDVTSRTVMVCMTCTAMLMSGCRIAGMRVTREYRVMAVTGQLGTVVGAGCGAALGTIMLGPFVLLAVMDTPARTAFTISASAWFRTSEPEAIVHYSL